MNLKKIEISKAIKRDLNIDIRADEIIFDLKSKSLYTYYKSKKIGAYYDNDIKQIVMYGNKDLSIYFVLPLMKLIGVYKDDSRR